MCDAARRLIRLRNLLADELADALDSLPGLRQDVGEHLKAMNHFRPDFKFDLDSGSARALREAGRVVRRTS